MSPTGYIRPARRAVMPRAAGEAAAATDAAAERWRAIIQRAPVRHRHFHHCSLRCHAVGYRISVTFIHSRPYAHAFSAAVAPSSRYFARSEMFCFAFAAICSVCCWRARLARRETSRRHLTPPPRLIFAARRHGADADGPRQRAKYATACFCCLVYFAMLQPASMLLRRASGA